MTPSGIEPSTFRFVAWFLNHYATAAPGDLYVAKGKAYVLTASVRPPDFVDFFELNISHRTDSHVFTQFDTKVLYKTCQASENFVKVCKLTITIYLREENNLYCYFHIS
jgi:hypothetical protein